MTLGMAPWHLVDETDRHKEALVSQSPCAFADSASTVMSGVMISLTPCIKAEVDRQAALDEYAEFQDADDMIQKLNMILSNPHGFPSIPARRKDCHTMTFEAKEAPSVCHVSRAGLRDP